MAKLLYTFLLLSFVLSAVADEMPILQFDSIVSPEYATHGMVATQEARATEIGVKILQQGGNAVDAAVAIGFALAVTLPRAGNLGGGGFMMIYDSASRQVNALDYREKAPAAAYRDMFLNKKQKPDKNKSRFSIFASGVPGTVAGMVAAHKKYGKLPFKQLVQPAIELAQGSPMTFALAQSLNSRRQRLSKHAESNKIFVKANNKLWQVGDQFVQADLAKVLSRIAQTQGKDFYHGETAKKISGFFAQSGGLINAKDLSDYRAVWRKPVSVKINDYEIFSMPPPSSGGVHLIQLLNIFQQLKPNHSSANSAAISHIKTEAMKYAYADRSKYLGDPDFVQIPLQQLTSVNYAKTLAAKIDRKKATPSIKIKPGQWLDKESPQTTHYSVIDKHGNMVSNTYTLNFSFGSGITVPGAGILLNNEMDDFSAKPGSANAYGLLGDQANAIEANKRPLSSMTPIIVTNRGQPWLASGSPGGSRIISTVFNFLINRLFYKMNIAEATIAPRIHHQWYPDQLLVEKSFPQDSAILLKSLGHKVIYSNPWGSVHSVEYANGLFMGYADPRRPGALAKGVNLPSVKQ